MAGHQGAGDRPLLRRREGSAACGSIIRAPACRRASSPTARSTAGSTRCSRRSISVREGRVMLVGSSMGGWIALHAALRRPDRGRRLARHRRGARFHRLGLIRRDEKADAARDGKLERRNPDGPSRRSPTRGFWQSGEAHRLLDAPIALAIPVRLVHGDRRPRRAGRRSRCGWSTGLHRPTSSCA